MFLFTAFLLGTSQLLAVVENCLNILFGELQGRIVCCTGKTFGYGGLEQQTNAFAGPWAMSGKKCTSGHSCGGKLREREKEEGVSAWLEKS